MPTAPPLRPCALCQGFERVSEVHGALAGVIARAPWDGSDGEAPLEDEFDLADLMGDDAKEEL